MPEFVNDFGLFFAKILFGFSPLPFYFAPPLTNTIAVHRSL